MPKSFLLDPVQILYGPKHKVIKDSVLIQNGNIIAFGEKAKKRAKEIGIKGVPADQKLLAPCLVDPHSFLEEPINGRSENLKTLRSKAAKAGYGHIAILPRSPSWRDRPEDLQGFDKHMSDVFISVWGGFSKGGQGKELTSHRDLIEYGAIGIAEDDSIPPIALLKKGLVLQEIDDAPLLLAPRDKKLQGDGIIREGVETLRAGWSPDPLASEIIPLKELLGLHKEHPEISMRIMNISTAESVLILSEAKPKTLTSVCWWHLLKDRTSITSDEIGWKVIPSLGGKEDRNALKQGLRDAVITAVSVNGTPQIEEAIQLPPDSQSPGITGYELVLPLLWQELIIKSGWEIEQLWRAISFGPSQMLKIKEECLEINSNRWLLFDPFIEWTNNPDKGQPICAANEPCEGQKVRGKVLATGLINPENQND